MFKIIQILFTVAVIGLAVLLIASKLPIPGNFSVLIVQSGSMEPTIQTGAIVVVKSAARYEPGDVITFRPSVSRRAEPITHRIVERAEAGGTLSYLTKGDANEEPDLTPVPHARVVGRVLFDVPYVGYALAAARKPIGFILIIIVPALALAMEEILSIVREVKRLRARRRAAG